jgi:hypothetical protein
MAAEEVRVTSEPLLASLKEPDAEAVLLTAAPLGLAAQGGRSASLLADVAAVARASVTDGMFLATLLGFLLMLLYTLADAHKAWEAQHQLSMNVCMALLCWLFLPIVLPFVRSPCGARAAGSQLQAAGWALALLADYSLLAGTIAFAGLGVLLFLAGLAPAYMVALLLVECAGCWGFLLSACAYAASWVLGVLPELPAKDVGAAAAMPTAATEGAGEAAAACARALAVTQLEWWAHALNIGGSLVYVLASTSSTLLVLAGGQDVPMLDAQTDLRQAMAQSFVVGDLLWTLDAAVFLGIWAREALRAQSAKRAAETPGGLSEALKE